jgi:hypothetical protein
MLKYISAGCRKVWDSFRLTTTESDPQTVERAGAATNTDHTGFFLNKDHTG